jgi:hypothetical protein
MNWWTIGGGALLVLWLLGRRVAKPTDDPVEPLFGGSGEGGTGLASEGFYGGFGGGDGGMTVDTGTTITPMEKGEPAPFGSRSLVEGFVDSIGFGSLSVGDAKVDLEPTVVTAGKMDSLDIWPSGASPRSAQVAADTSSSTAYGASSAPMSSLMSTANNDRAVSAAVQAQPPRSFSTVSAAISESNMLPQIVTKPVVATPARNMDVIAPVQLAPTPIAQSFVSSIRPAAASVRPSSLLSDIVQVRR